MVYSQIHNYNNTIIIYTCTIIYFVFAADFGVDGFDFFPFDDFFYMYRQK